MKFFNKTIKLLFDLFQWLRKKYWKIFNIETFGVRTLILKDNKILLVRHRYGNLWVMPGGKIDKNEDPEIAALRELKEEVGIIGKKLDYKLGYYKNTTGGKNDNVYCFVLMDFEINSTFKPKFIDFLEIGEMSWFYLDQLPELISRATKIRINEFMENKRNFIGDW
jgi:8-oxo-dGTP pyrophosphatase MutT (NUDIX family)